MNILLIFFAIPLATIILSIILQTLICCPFKIAGIAFSIFVVLAFALGGTAALIVAAIIYTIISFLAAVITMIIQNRSNSCEENEYIWNNNCTNNCNNNNWNDGSNNRNWDNNVSYSYRRCNRT